MQGIGTFYHQPNRRIPNGTYGGVRGRGLVTPSYSIKPRLYVGDRDQPTK